MDRDGARQLVQEILGTGDEDLVLRDVLLDLDLPESPVGSVPRHAAMFELIRQFREKVGYGGISSEAAQNLGTVGDVIDYLCRLKPPEDE